MTQNDFWKQVKEEIRKCDLLTHPFYRAWTEGQLTRADLGFYGRQYLHHVSAFPTYLTALHTRLPEGLTRSAILRNAAEEEIAGLSHADLWRQFVKGIEPEPPTGDGEILPEIGQLIETFREMARSAALPTALGAFYAYESQIPSVAREKAAGLKRFHDADNPTCEYFTLHMIADAHHTDVWHGIINRCVCEDAACAPEVLDGVARGAKALWHALNGIEAEQPDGTDGESVPQYTSSGFKKLRSRRR